jgi:hypothetical protein
MICVPFFHLPTCTREKETTFSVPARLTPLAESLNTGRKVYSETTADARPK